ncbi:MAG: division/cell wall cluster transcriptional repressor MraZ [Gammaproteobacteria bacterium]|nr:division/cell wall cluster transcriptional repressor MraZ [Gammaproteobacteria bacterium]
MFRGIHTVNLDAKGRMAIPTRYRQRLMGIAEGKLIITIDPEEACLLLYPQSVWEEIEAKIAALPSLNKIARRLQRLLIGHAVEVEMDGNGRILVATPLRDYAALNKQMVLLGQGQKFELWDEKSWKTRRDSWLSEESGSDGSLPDALGDIVL